MKKIVMLTMLLVSASTFMMAQTPIEQAREKAKALIKGGVTDISKILPKHESDDDEDIDDDDDSTIDPLEGKSEEYIRGFNDARRKTYEEQKASFAKAGIDFNQTALSKLILLCQRFESAIWRNNLFLNHFTEGIKIFINHLHSSQLAFWKNLLINFKIFFCHITFFINFAKIMDKLSKEYP